MKNSACIPLENKSDVIVIGGGPSGSFAAFRLAQVGVDVTVFEEHREIGIPTHCAGHLSIKGLTRLAMYPLPTELVENVFQGASFYSPSGNRFSVHLASPVTCAVDRIRFDTHVAEKAQDAGADYRLGTRVENLIIKHGTVEGVTVTQQGKTQKMFSKIVIDAEGISSRLLRETGLSGPDPHMLVNGIETEVENVKGTELDSVDVYLGAEYAPGLYAWLIPKKDRRAKVGLAAKSGHPKELLEKLMVKHPVASGKLRDARITQTAFHAITLGGPVRRTCCNGFIAVGDAASQVKSTTGGGVIFGMTCAAVAAEVAYKAICQNDFSSETLGQYQQRCDKALGFDARTMVRIRRTLDLMSDKRLDGLIKLCSKTHLDKTLREVDDVDLQGRTLLHLLGNPRVLTTIGYFFLTYLSGNL